MAATSRCEHSHQASAAIRPLRMVQMAASSRYECTQRELAATPQLLESQAPNHLCELGSCPTIGRRSSDESAHSGLPLPWFESLCEIDAAPKTQGGGARFKGNDRREARPRLPRTNGSSVSLRGGGHGSSGLRTSTDELIEGNRRSRVSGYRLPCGDSSARAYRGGLRLRLSAVRSPVVLASVWNRVPRVHMGETFWHRPSKDAMPTGETLRLDCPLSETTWRVYTRGRLSGAVPPARGCSV